MPRPNSVFQVQGAMGDALHALSCAAGYNIRWLLRAIAHLGLGAGLLCPARAAHRSDCGYIGGPDIGRAHAEHATTTALSVHAHALRGGGMNFAGPTK